ncbi:MAG: FecR domain-containing protein [Pseudomonadota bacterium]
MVERKQRPDTEEILTAAHEWMLRLESPDATAQDQSDFERWLAANPRHRDIYDQALTFREALVRMSEDDLEADIAKRSGAERFTALLDGLRDGASNVRFQVAGGALATMAAMAMLASPIFDRPLERAPELAVSVAEYSSAVGETKIIDLSDGTRVTLGAASAMTSSYSDDKRVVQLASGTAYFDVMADKDRPFTVKAGNLTATALGTSFDVRRGENTLTVAVAEGTVEVGYPLTLSGNSTSMISTKMVSVGEQVTASLENGLRSITPIDSDRVGAWREDRLVYTGETLAEVIFDANRYSAVPIAFAPGSERLKELRLRGVFRGSDIGRLLTNITQLHPIEIDRSDPGILLLREKP